MWFLAFFLSALLAFASPEETALQNQNQIASSPAWLKLLHFRGSHSEAEGLFLDPKGDEDPLAELRATVHGFYSDAATQCRFPARLQYLKSVLPLENLPKARCPDFEHWRDTIAATGVELIFASAFVNSPSSMYGHTMLKFPRAGKTAGNSLLDYTLSFGADTGDSSGLSYMVKGLFGIFRGYFATAPFYLKVLEYTQMENRDLWIYPIKLNREELDTLIAHAWELKNAGFRYYFLKKNCAYFLLELLEVVRPNSNFVDHFPLWSVPMDTIRILQKENLLGEPSYRPSRFQTLKLARKELSSEESKQAKALVDDPNASTINASAATLRAAYEYFRYKYGTARNETQQKILAAMSALPPSKPEVIPIPPPPDTGHLSSRAFLSAGLDRQNTFEEFGYRGTLHDFLDNPIGYEDSSELTMGDFRGRVEKGSVFLEHSDILKIRSTPARDSWVPRTSWMLRVGTDRAKDFACSAWHCFYGTVEGGPGAAFSVLQTKIFLLAELQSDVGAPFSKSYRIGVGPSFGWLVTPFEWWRVLLQADRRWDFLGDSMGLNKVSVEQSWILKTNWEIRARGEVQRGYREALGGLYYLF